MYYFVATDSGEILESDDGLPDSYILQIAQEWANEIKGDVHVIKGEHSGIKASPKSKEEIRAQRIAVFNPGHPDVKRAAELEKLERWTRNVVENGQ